MNEQKYYITVGEILESMEESFGLADWTDVRKSLIEGTSPVDFGTSRRKPTMASDTFGRIPLLEFIEGDGLATQGEFMDVDKLKEFFAETADFSWYSKGGDNTYNYNGFLERDINFEVFENSETDDVIAFFAVHIGLDIRAGYSKYFAMRFDTIYDFYEALGNHFEVAYFSAIVDDRDVSISVDASAVSESLLVYVSSIESAYYLDYSDVYLDMFDEEEAIKDLTELIGEEHSISSVEVVK